MGLVDIMVTDAKSLFDSLQNSRSAPKERQTMMKDWVKNTVVKMKWAPITDTLADILTKDMPMSERPFPKFYETEKCSLTQNREEARQRRERQNIGLPQRQATHDTDD